MPALIPSLIRLRSPVIAHILPLVPPPLHLFSNNPMSDETIPRDLSQLTTLKELLLADVGLTKMPKAIYKLTSLTRLSLAGNSIGHLDGDLKDLSRLEGLNFSRNALDRFPVMLPSCVSLRRLYLNGNPLRRDSFQRSISNLSRLDLLSLSQVCPCLVGRVCLWPPSSVVTPFHTHTHTPFCRLAVRVHRVSAGDLPSQLASRPRPLGQQSQHPSGRSLPS